MIRDALPIDAQGIAQVHVRSWQQAYRELLPSDFLDSLSATLPRREAYWRDALTRGEGDVLVAELDGQVVGWIAVGPCRDQDRSGAEWGEVQALYVLADHWGKGIGTALWQTGSERLFDQGYGRLSLWVLAANARAISFYQRHGARAEPDSRRSLVRGGVTLEEVRYVWRNKTEAALKSN